MPIGHGDRRGHGATSFDVTLKVASKEKQNFGHCELHKLLLVSSLKRTTGKPSDETEAKTA
jgi:hypothetical protein